MDDDYYVGDVWAPEDVITDPVTKGLVDPTEVLFKVQKPDGSSESVTVTRVSTGRYVARVSLTLAGRWIGTFTSPSGQYQGVAKKSIVVQP